MENIDKDNVCIVNYFMTLNQGGVKAVVWTDVMQMSIAVLGMVALSIVGIIKAGGLSEVSDFARDTMIALEYTKELCQYY